MKRIISLFMVLLVVSILGYLTWRLLPTTNCCDTVDKEYAEYDALVTRAVSGDLSAMRQLYDSAKAADHLDDARRWALIGAMAGSDELMREYVEMYKTLSQNSRIADEAVIRKNVNRDGARRLAEMLRISL